MDYCCEPEVELERRVWQADRISPTRNIAAPDCAWIHTQPKRHKHVTLQLWWEEYQAHARRCVAAPSASGIGTGRSVCSARCASVTTPGRSCSSITRAHGADLRESSRSSGARAGVRRRGGEVREPPRVRRVTKR